MLLRWEWSGTPTKAPFNDQRVAALRKRQKTRHDKANAMTEETTKTPNATTPEDLKRLGFIYEYGTLATDTATKFYELAKKQAPSTLAPGKTQED